MDYQLQLSERVGRLRASPVRNILSVASKPGMLSLAGGLPAADTFPLVENLPLFEHADWQYGPSEGEAYLRNAIARKHEAQGWSIHPDQVLLLSGSQQGIDLVSKLIIDVGTRIALESPTYLAALQVFDLFGAEYETFSPDSLHQNSVSDKPSMLYTVPTFQNPTSSVYTRQERQTIADYCSNHNVLLFEDDPYRELCYQPCDRTPICSLVQHDNWIYQSSFSKIFSPGIRLGYLVCPEALYPKLLMLKQASDLHSNRVSQRLVFQMLNDESYQYRLDTLTQHYRRKRNAFNDSLEKYFGKIASWEIPSGGLFFWLHLNGLQRLNTQTLLSKAIEENITFMPGEPFFADRRQTCGCIRLNFSQLDADQYDRALSKLASIFRTAG